METCQYHVSSCILETWLSETHSAVVNPDQVGAIQRDGITTPDVAGVDVRECNVLDNDVFNADHANTLALDRGTALADERLVAADGDTQDTGVVVADADGRRIRLVVLAPVVLVNGHLAGGASTPGGATRAAGRALRAGEVVGALNDDDTGLAVAQVADELVGGRGVHGGGAATTGDAGGETLGSA